MHGPLRSLVEGAAWWGAHWLPRMRERVNAALAGNDEYRLIQRDGRGPGLAGFACFGLTAGAEGAGALYAVIVAPGMQRRGYGRALVGDVFTELRALHARFALAEVPDDPAHAGYIALLRACAFVDAGRVPDLVADGTDLLLLRRDLESPA
jgi:ribosomal protein S18 acetylase RimI-like enzyme